MPTTKCQETPTGYGYRPCVDWSCPRCHPPLSRHQRASQDLAAFHSAQWHKQPAIVPAEWGDYTTMRRVATKGR